MRQRPPMMWCGTARTNGGGGQFDFCACVYIYIYIYAVFMNVFFFLWLLGWVIPSEIRAKHFCCLLFFFFVSLRVCCTNTKRMSESLLPSAAELAFLINVLSVSSSTLAKFDGRFFFILLRAWVRVPANRSRVFVFKGCRMS